MTGSLAAGVPVLEGIDTRRLTRHLRERGAMRGVVAPGNRALPGAHRSAAGLALHGGAGPRVARNDR